MHLADEDRSTTGLGEALTSTPKGYVPLKRLATIRAQKVQTKSCKNQQRRIVVSANTDGIRGIAAIVAEIRAIIDATDMTSGYVVRLETKLQAQEEATQTILFLSLISLALIFLVLYSRYKSMALAATISPRYHWA